MKLILLSFLRRWWIRYAVAGILVLAVDVTAQLVPDLQRAWTPYLFAPWLGGFLVTMDLVSGTAPLLCSCPFPRGKLDCVIGCLELAYRPLAWDSCNGLEASSSSLWVWG